MEARQCPYKNCHLQCKSKQTHNARYAFLHNFSTLAPSASPCVKEGKSKKIDYLRLAQSRQRLIESSIQDEKI